MISTPDTANTAGGNTSNPGWQPKSLRRMCFTLNNYTDEEIQRIHEYRNTDKFLICYGLEVGEQGTPHVQGYAEFKNPKKFNTVKNLFPRAHIERAKGSRKQNIEYCSKDGEFFSNFPLSMKQKCLLEYNDIEWYDWQQEIIDLHSTAPNTRHIHWYVDEIGNHGKTFLARYMVLKHRVLLCGSKKQDVFHQVAKRLEDEEKEDPFRMVILDVPRHDEGFVNYGVLESLKNGLIVSGKYEGGTFVFPSPHVIVFSNSAPDMSKFSQDRWIVKYLD